MRMLRKSLLTTPISSSSSVTDTGVMEVGPMILHIMIMIASATKGEVAFPGAIDNKDVRKEVIRYLEGGSETYKLKYLKCNIPKKLKSK